jgi:hypothetical protein
MHVKVVFLPEPRCPALVMGAGGGLATASSGRSPSKVVMTGFSMRQLSLPMVVKAPPMGLEYRWFEL